MMCGRHGERWRQDGGDAEGGAHEDREHVDPDPPQAEGARQVLAARQHDDGVMRPVGDDGYDRDAVTEGEPDETLVPSEIDAVPLGPGATSLEVSTGVHEHGGALLERQVRLTPAGGDHPDPSQEGADHGDAEKQVVPEGVGGALEPPSLEHGQPDHPGVGHVEEARVIADHQDRPLGREVVQSLHLG